ncbi:hypothetical protein [Parashewanella tropica]|uniref:hypothetical protein n=1 Tax=Parashewanella tropica TaxID=2547970 RepID=UPI00105AA4CE|nr:hypothetical protein [Parashewanella tropica]
MRWLLGLLLFSSAAMSAPNVVTLLADENNQDPIKTMRQIERSEPGVISSFSVNLNKKKLQYIYTLVNLRNGTVTHFEYRGTDGHLLKRYISTLVPKEHSELEAVRFIEKNKLLFSKLVDLAIDKSQVHLLKAELDHDLGISYLELELIDDNGPYRLAFDVETLRPLPLLRWY